MTYDLDGLSKELLLDMYYKMMLIRRFEEKVVEMYRAGEIPGIAHGYIGEEGVAVGVCSALRRDDYILSTHRGHGHSLAKGIDPKHLMAELYGKKTGVCKGIGGSMHSTEPEVGVIFSSAIVGGNIPIAVGVALAFKMRREDRVVVSFFGDGATNTGAFHEALNLASVWKLPIVFVCENNFYAISMHVSKSTSAKEIVDRAVSYNMPGVVVDGNDVIAVYNAAAAAVNRARKGEGPTLIEARTYRWLDHGMYYLGKYRPEDEVVMWKQKCPIRTLRDRLLIKGIATEVELNSLDEKVVHEVDEAIRFARESAEPDLDFVKQFVYVR
ncbi:MAG: thiamine pyrophosphate-dependent dehydrogenase E1 component subunit alpha [Sulfolobales archaeon]|nr:thiamine pyrophosphate-dependent dehydrogenase E1 component subunit alpha [Sulfolobales archaeon]